MAPIFVRILLIYMNIISIRIELFAALYFGYLGTPASLLISVAPAARKFKETRSFVTLHAAGRIFSCFVSRDAGVSL